MRVAWGSGVRVCAPIRGPFDCAQGDIGGDAPIGGPFDCAQGDIGVGTLPLGEATAFGEAPPTAMLPVECFMRVAWGSGVRVCAPIRGPFDCAQGDIGGDAPIG
jgi:hypothetical protein